MSRSVDSVRRSPEVAWNFLKSIFTYSTSDPITALLGGSHDGGGSDLDIRTRAWRDAKVQELGYVGITAAILASLFASAIAWPHVPEDAYDTKGCWYVGLILIVSSIASATQQAITLHRFNTLPNSLSVLRKLLRSPNDEKRASILAVYVWQLPVMFLRLGIFLFIIGMFFLLWNAARVGQDLSLPNLQIAVSFTVIFAFAALNHSLSVLHCYMLWRLQERSDS
ncbi:uncharacterized protein F4812DRAFT_45042 [Daldinia caldariorum]|uniref:uncharacterized protein n=1 Tax=Daldinia caldariorum TaxID=326644 RepID=UPI002008DDF0|nr:uncharacterized protein F4812DRAFT_45042 [Daldinia caldariorum]KAI1473277.1 hypothetical protein F4812DRAFT_45042 [Daldinia caldariorum]